jgi:hypothetical protein
VRHISTRKSRDRAPPPSLQKTRFIREIKVKRSVRRPGIVPRPIIKPPSQLSMFSGPPILKIEIAVPRWTWFPGIPKKKSKNS